MTNTSQNLWAFSLERYARHDVPRLCLVLQDHYGFDVNLLFFTAWLTHRMGHCPPELLDAAIELSNTWRGQVVSRLRAARRWMKQAHPQDLIGHCTDISCSGPGLTVSAKQLREQIKAIELSAERQQQQLLQALAQQWLPTDQSVKADKKSGESSSRAALSVLAIWQQLHRQMSNEPGNDADTPGKREQSGASDEPVPTVNTALEQLATALFCGQPETDKSGLRP